MVLNVFIVIFRDWRFVNISTKSLTKEASSKKKDCEKLGIIGEIFIPLTT